MFRFRSCHVTSTGSSKRPACIYAQSVQPAAYLHCFLALLYALHQKQPPCPASRTCFPLTSLSGTCPRAKSVPGLHNKRFEWTHLERALGIVYICAQRFKTERQRGQCVRETLLIPFTPAERKRTKKDPTYHTIQKRRTSLHLKDADNTFFTRQTIGSSLPGSLESYPLHAQEKEREFRGKTCGDSLRSFSGEDEDTVGFYAGNHKPN